LKSTLAHLIVALDGKGMQSESGTQGRRGYVGDYTFMLLAATTPPKAEAYNAMSALGPRLFFAWVRTDGDEEEDDAIDSMGRDKDREIELCRSATERLMRTIWAGAPLGIVWDRESGDREAKRWIHRAALLVCKGRSGEMPGDMDGTARLTEAPWRARNNLHNLAIGHAVLQGRRAITLADVAPVLEVAVETIRPPGCHVVRALMRAREPVGAEEVARMMRCSEHTALEAIKQTVQLGIGKMIEVSGKVGRPRMTFSVEGTDEAWLCSPEVLDKLMWEQPAGKVMGASRRLMQEQARREGRE
jgi:predicted transcriptional regulator